AAAVEAAAAVERAATVERPAGARGRVGDRCGAVPPAAGRRPTGGTAAPGRAGARCGRAVPAASARDASVAGAAMPAGADGGRDATDHGRGAEATAEVASAGVVRRVVAPVVERVERPVGPEERIVRALPVVPGSDGREVWRPGAPPVVVRAHHEAPAAAVDIGDRVRAVVAVGLARIAKVTRVADEV